MALRLLRNFGHKIINVHITLADKKLMEKLKFYFAEYCLESLKNLLLSYCNFETLYCKEQFINIETIIVYYCCFHYDLPCCTNVPNLNSLSVLGPQFKKNFAKMAFHFPSLTHLSLKFESNFHYSDEATKHQEKEIIDLLKMNPQIVRLELQLLKNYSRALLQNITECLSKLQHLVFRNDGSTLFQNEDIFYSKSVERFELTTTLKSEVLHIPFIFNKLKSLTLCTCCTKASFDFIAKHKETKSIHLFDTLIGTHTEIKFELIPSNIEELTIFFYDLPEHFLFRFLQERRRLKFLSLNGIFPTINANEFCQRLCDVMKINSVQFDVKSIENIESKTIVLHVKKFSNFSEMESIIKISNYRKDQKASEINWYTINNSSGFAKNS